MVALMKERKAFHKNIHKGSVLKMSPSPLSSPNFIELLYNVT